MAQLFKSVALKGASVRRLEAARVENPGRDCVGVAPEAGAGLALDLVEIGYVTAIYLKG